MSNEFPPPNGVQPENDLFEDEEDEVHSGSLRFQAVLLMLALLLPLVLAAIEFFTGSISRVVEQVFPLTGNIMNF